jgi:hypothetical protein
MSRNVIKDNDEIRRIICRLCIGLFLALESAVFVSNCQHSDHSDIRSSTMLSPQML